MSSAPDKISAATVRADFNDPVTVVHYARAAHFLGLWQSERILIERFFPDRTAPLLEAGCGAGRVTLGLCHLGYQNITAFDFAEELLDQARHLAAEQGVTTIRFLHADATRLSEKCHVLRDTSSEAAQPAPRLGPSSPPSECHVIRDTFSLPKGGGFAGALFLFNGLMQIPGRDNRRAALRELHAVCRLGALLFTTHDRDVSPTERALWRLEKLRWENGTQDPRLVEFGDRYFEDETGRTFMHLPDRAEIIADLTETGWEHTFDNLRQDIAKESRAVRDFSDECRFWCAVRR
jgi:SAM-dependent methyltransferase